MKMQKLALVLVGSAFVAGGLGACKEETTGDKIDNAADKAKDAADDVKDAAKDAAPK
jgi:hypothetical protein